jgi:RNA-binding protein
MVWHLAITRNNRIEERKHTMTSKQRSYLKGLAMNIDPVFQIGKSSVTPENVEAISEVFNTHELIKIAVLKNCIDDPKEIANVVAERTQSQVVQVIGKKIVLYKPFKQDPKIILPK